ncbi:MAG: NUDIX hydrolase [Verrucomicrobiota bacterium]
MTSEPLINPWITHQTREIYDNPWITVTESEITHPGGGDGIYGVVHFKNRAIGVVPIDKEGYTWLVGQYRYTLKSYEWEIPEGGCPETESPEQAAIRELKEETGLIAQKLTLLMDNLALSNSVTNERCSIFVATQLSQQESNPDPTEQLQVKRLPLVEAIRMAEQGEISDAVSVMALLRLANFDLSSL